MSSPARSPPRAVSCSAVSTSTATHRSGSVWPGSACSAPPSCWPRPRSPSATSPPGSATASRRSSPRRSRAGTGCRRLATAPATTADSPPRPDRRARRRPRPHPQAPPLGVVAGVAAPKVHALDQRPDVLVLLHDDIPLVLLDDVLGLSKLVSGSDHEARRVGPHAFVLGPGQPDLGLAATTAAFAKEHHLLAARGALPVLRPLHHALVSSPEQDLDLGDPFVRSRHRTFATPRRGGVSRARARESGRLAACRTLSPWTRRSCRFCMLRTRCGLSLGMNGSGSSKSGSIGSSPAFRGSSLWHVAMSGSTCRSTRATLGRTR